MSEVDYAELRALAENATPGPAGYTFGRVQALRDMQAHLSGPMVIALLDELERLLAIEAEVEWEVQTVIVGQDGDEWDEVRAESIPDARDDIKTWLASNDLDDGESIVIRTRRKAGPWVPVPEHNPEPKGSES